ncbi:queuosine precursor transporter [Rapidithrix thailandica]|uniref:Probable queuosine precursor transporter n=1 Tax=Rapidithrix thailandica TaxID=413964 RepID=A0AAW9SCB6_9BACT
MEANTISIEKKKINLFILLCSIFLTNALVAEMVGSKLFSLEALLGAKPAAIQLFGQGPYSFTLTAGVLLWPVVFITTDVINEYFGKSGVRKISFLTAGLITYMFITIVAVTELPPAQLWLDLYPELKISEAFNTIFRQGLGIIIGSLTAFLVGQLVDVMTFQWLRRFTGSKKIWLRATGSTLVSQLIDSFVVLFVAFFIFGRMSMSEVLAIGVVNYIYKFSVAVLLTPLLYVAHYFIDRYLGKEASERIVEEASHSKLF